MMFVMFLTHLDVAELEWMLAQVGAIQSDIEKPEKPEIEDAMTSAIRQSRINQDDSDDD